MERTACLRGVWEAVKEVLSQKMRTRHLHSSPLLLGNLSGLFVIVTGATSGIGLHTARELAFAGAHVTMACRNVTAANQIAHQWMLDAETSRSSLNVQVMELDLLSLSSVRRFAASWSEEEERPLHILINNAGVLFMGDPQKFSEDGLEQHIQVNHIAPALLTLLLLPSMLKAKNTSRIVNVNSTAHQWGVVDPKVWNSRVEKHKFISAMKVYGTSKLANLMFLKALANRLSSQNQTSIQCIAVHPGAVSTKMIPGPKKGLSFWMFNPSEGARSVLFCATSTEVMKGLSSGFAYYSCDCKPGKISPAVENLEACFDVWDNTFSILGLNSDYLSEKHIL